MSNQRQLPNRVRLRRLERGWSQDELARKAGISRAAVSAVEINRLVPSVAAALSLATVFGCTVEDLFGLPLSEGTKDVWAWPCGRLPCRYWQAKLQGRLLHYPVEATAAGEIAHDGMFQNNTFIANGAGDPETTLVMACCDPAAGVLVGEYARACGFRMLVLPRSSKNALTLLGKGLIHVAGVHFGTSTEPDGNVLAVKNSLGAGYRLLRVARWQEGLSVAPGLGVSTASAALRAKLRWVGREPGSAARQCLDELRGNHPTPKRFAYDHRGVAEAVRCGWADIGVCHRIVSEQAELDFYSVREEDFDLCYPNTSEGDPRIAALLGVIRSSSYRRLLGELPGYDTGQAGETQSVL